MTRYSTRTSTNVDERIRRLVDRTEASRHIHSALLGVETTDGTLSIRIATGSADPVDPYFVASITNMFTASIVMQLLDEHRIRIDDRIVDLLPGLDLTGLHRHDEIGHTPALELHHRLYQTSGLADYFAGGFEDDFKRSRDRRYGIEDVVDIGRSTEANFPPGDRNGTRSAYSDTIYQLLGAIIESITGSTYAQSSTNESSNRSA